MLNLCFLNTLTHHYFFSMFCKHLFYFVIISVPLNSYIINADKITHHLLILIMKA